MKGDFFGQFKSYLLSHHKDELTGFIQYYETLVQAKDKIEDLINDSEKYYMDIRYQEDKTDGYSDGSFEFHFYEKPLSADYGWQSHLGYHYEMDLGYDERYWGYCECSPEMEGYNPVHKCCGNGCDWTAPRIEIRKISDIALHAFDGVERDIWELEKNWGKHTENHEEELRKQRLKQLEDQIKELEKEKNLLNKK